MRKILEISMDTNTRPYNLSVNRLATKSSTLDIVNRLFELDADGHLNVEKKDGVITVQYIIHDTPHPAQTTNNGEEK